MKSRPVTRLLRTGVLAYRALPRRRPPSCRYEPTCSAFALEALERHGAYRGTILAVRRLGRCHPWGGAGYDPVPEAGTPEKAGMATVRTLARGGHA